MGGEDNRAMKSRRMVPYNRPYFECHAMKMLVKE